MTKPSGKTQTQTIRHGGRREALNGFGGAGKLSSFIGMFVLLFLAISSFAQEQLLLKETFTREYSVFIGGNAANPYPQVTSREFSLFIGTDIANPYPQVISREMSFVVTTPGTPDPVTGLQVTASPTGSSATLNWSSYDEPLQQDVVRYLIYLSNAPFTNVSGLTPYLTVPAGTSLLTLTNLTPGQDHYFAVVAEDELGNYNATVSYAGGYAVTAQTFTRDYVMFVGGSQSNLYPQTSSREVSMVVTTPAVPDPVALNISSTPTGNGATLNWSSYNEVLEKDVVRYNIYISSQPFTNVTGLTPFTTIPAGTTVLTVSNLTAFQDHFFAVVAVDALGQFNPVVNYSAAYVLTAQTFTREYSMFVGGNSSVPYPQVISREVSVVVPDNSVPDPVTGVNSGFAANTSVSAFSAIDLNWSGYNEALQHDVVRYRVYVVASFFTDVTGMTPYTFAPAGSPFFTVGGLHGGNIYYVAVVAESELGNFNPTVRAVSAQASVGALGDVQNLTVASAAATLHFAWIVPTQVDAFLSHYNIYFNGATNPIVVPSATTTYDATNLQPATGYPFRITTVDTFNTESPGVSVLAATLLGNPSPIQTESLDGLVRLTWKQVEPNNLVQAYNIYESATAFTNVTGLTPLTTTRGSRADVTGLANGTAYFFAVTTVNISSGENKTVQSVTATPNIVAGNFADLAITNVTAPSTAYSGQVITINWAVTNIGAGATSAQNGTPVTTWHDQVVLSPDNIFGDADDLILTNVPHSGALNPATGYAGAVTLQLPTNLVGDFNVFIFANADATVFENLDQGTNLAVAAHQIEVSPPVAPLITQQPLDQVVFENSATAFSVTAQGSAPLSYQWHHGALTLSGATNSTLVLTNVQFSDAGNYFVQVSNIAGSTNSVTATLTVNIPPPDLSVLNIQSPAAILAGQPVSVSWLTTNGGFSTANAPWQEELLLANNPAGTNATVLLTITVSNSLTASNGVVRSPSVIFPGGLSGNYYLAVLVDSAGQVTEGNEANNYFVAPAPVLIQSPDLAVAKLTAPPTALFNQPFNVSFVVTNQGNGPAIPTWNDRVFLSPSSSLVPGAIALQTVSSAVNPLAAGAGYTNSATVMVPFTAQSQAGSYWILVQADADNSVTESVEANNTRSSPITLSVPPLPDLTVGQVALSNNVSPVGIPVVLGETIPVSWVVTNNGAATVSNAWRESLYLVNGFPDTQQLLTNSSAYPLIGSFVFTNVLAPGASVVRSGQITVPINALAGNPRVAVFVDSENVVIEQNETNNIAVSQTTLMVSATFTLTLPVTNVNENTSSPSLTCQLTDNFPTGAAFQVSLTSSASNHLIVPPAVTIPANATTVSFTATVVDDGVADADALVTITATGPVTNGLQTTAQILVVNTDSPHLSISLPSQITEGQTLTVSVSSDTTMNHPVTVVISSSDSTRLSVPASVTIPTNTNSVSFALAAVDNTTIDPLVTDTLSVSAAGYVSGSATVTVLDNDAPALALSLDRTNISEADGPFAAVGTVTRTPVTDQPVTVGLASGNTAAATVPAAVTIPALQSSAQFYVAAVADNHVTGTKESLLSAQSLDVASHPAGAVATGELFVTDTNGPALTLVLASKVVSKGLNPATTATVSRNTPATSNLLVTLTSSASNEVAIPSTVVISNGQASATFPIASLDDGFSDTNVSVAINASAPNVGGASQALMVTDLGLPDLTVNNVTAPGTAFTGEPFTVSFQLLNQGLGSLVSPVTQNVYLTPSLNSGSNLLVGVSSFGGPLLGGQSSGQFVVVPGPAVPPPGTYWIIVQADAGNAVSELNEMNNQAISSTPVVITSEYTAFVHTGVTNVAAGTPVPLTGSATLATGGPAANKPVNILLMVRGLQRVISVTTDASGNFSTVFTPLPMEAGMYSIAAVAPGITSAPAQAQFTILGATLAPNPLAVAVTEGSGSVSQVTMQNLSELPLTGLTATVGGAAANLNVTTMFSQNSLIGQGTVGLSIHVSAANSTIRQSGFAVHITSAEGVALDLPVNVTVIPLVAQLSVAPSQLSAAMLRGAQTTVQFEVANLGGVPSGPLTVSAPPAPWLGVATTNPLPSLAPGQSNLVSVLLTPGTDLPLGPYTGALTVSGSGIGLTVPFTFNCVSDGHGSLLIHSVDELTFFATNSPSLTNASVKLIDPLSRNVVATGFTDTNGLLLISNVMEGQYELDVTATQHAAFKGSATVTAGVTTDVETFLSMQTVTYTWTVVPTQVQDVTHITVLAEFEANVPAPVVVPSPASLDLSPLQQPGQFMDVPLTLANYGLIAVQGVNITISDNPNYQFDFLTRNIGTLPAHGTVTIPLRITRLANTGFRPLDGGDCEISLGIGYFFPCGQYDISTGIPIPVFNVTGDCGGGGAAGTVVVVGCNGCGGGGTVTIPPGQSTPSTCDQCMAKAIIECGIGYTPAGCAYGGWSCLAGLVGQGFNATTGENCVVQGVGCLGPVGNTVACLWSFLRCKCNGALSTVPSCVAGALGGGPSVSDFTVGLGLSSVDPRDVYVARSYPLIQLIQMILGDTDGHWFVQGSGGAFGAYFNGFIAAVQPDSSTGILISPDEFTNLMALPRPDGVTDAEVGNMLNRWNLTINNWRAGIYSVTNLPAGGNTNFISLYDYAAVSTAIGQQYQVAQAAGYGDPVAGFFAAIQDAETKLGGEGTCAKVVLELDQDAVLTRDAFSATLQLNNSGSTPLENLKVNLVVRNASGQDVTSLFGLEAPVFTGAISAIDGSGMLQSGSSGTAQWTLIPTVDAAPEVPTNYFVSGSLNYTLNGVAVTLPLSPASISVQPNPQLYVKYFHQRDVFADDPTTPQIEPSIPYSLGVMVQNRGFGTAYDFKITSAQPKIVDNEKGLLIDFKIIGAQVGNEAVSPSLTTDFGDIDPGQTVVGRWLLTSSLQGLFINYSATFEHVDPLGNPRLSLIDGVEIHEMNHLVQAEGAFNDGLPDFLVNDIADFNSLPDTLYLSDGRIEPVSVVESATSDAPASTGHLQVQLSVNFPSGFSYVQVPDPANGQFQLVGVIHSSGTNMLANDFWTTDRTFIGLGQPPIHENLLHLLDYHTNAGPDTYTLVYAAPSVAAQTNAPVSAVFALPPFSPATFGVVWSGANFVGQAPLAFYDIFVSDNNSPFSVWQPHTTDTGDLYTGQPGHTYSFYSVATDTAGNVEAPPATPDAITSVTLSNTAPTISFATGTVTVNEGTTLSISPIASDSDVPQQTLTFSLVPGAPAGVTINPATGLLTWPTTELDGPSINIIKVVVTDNGFPHLSSTGSVQVVVNEVNQAPILTPIGNYTISEGFLLRITNSAVDYDLPANTLTFSLGNPVPTGASIDPHTGIFSWRPGDTQGPTTNLITVTVTDNGVPPLSASQSFSVIVLDTLSDLTLTVGSTNLLNGESNTVPLVLAASLQLTNVNLQLTAPGTLLTNLALRGVSAEVNGISFNPLGSNAYTVNFVLNPALQTASLRSLATLDFVTVSNYHSTIATVDARDLTAEDTTGHQITNGGTIGGKIIIVGREPVLGIRNGATSQPSLMDLKGVSPQLTLYGRPGATYALLVNTNLLINEWTQLEEFVQSSRAVTVTLSNNLPLAFYDALEVKAEPPQLSIIHGNGPVLNLQLTGWPDVLYGLQTSTTLGSGSIWTPLTQFTLTNSTYTILWTNKGESERFFRGTVP